MCGGEIIIELEAKYVSPVTHYNYYYNEVHTGCSNIDVLITPYLTSYQWKILYKDVANCVGTCACRIYDGALYNGSCDVIGMPGTRVSTQGVYKTTPPQK